MRILFLTLKTFSATGGIEQFNRCFAKALQENAINESWKINILSAYDSHPPGPGYLDAGVFKGYGGNKAKFLTGALKAVRHSDAVIVGHINLAMVVLLGRLFFPAKKWILVAHGREVWEPLTAVQKKALQYINQVWCVSRYTRSVLVGQRKVPFDKTLIFPNTLHPGFVDGPPTISADDVRKRLGLSTEHKIVLTISRLTSTEKFKGYDLVLRTLPRLRQHFPTIRYLLCGKTDQQEQERIIKLIQELDVEDMVVLPGFIKDSELATFYQMADVFAMPSRKEGFGIVFIEAAWCGLPVIAGNQDGSSDALLDGELGKLIDPADMDALGQAILDSLNHPYSPKEKEAKKKLVEANFGFEVFKKRQLDALKGAEGD